MNIPLSSNAAEALKRMNRLDEALRADLRDSLDEISAVTVSHIKENRLSGKGPFPAAQHKLGVKTNRYRNSLRFTPAQWRGDALISAIGTNLQPYPGMHEHGATFTRKGGHVRLRTDASGELMLRNGRLATFAKRTHQRVRNVSYEAHQVKVPARAPLRHGLEDMQPRIGQHLSATVLRAAGRA